MIVKVVTAGPVATNSYLVGCSKTRVGCIIDPAANSSELLQRLIQKHSLSIQGIYLTHSHWDHFADAAKLKREYGYPLFCHSSAADNLARPGSDGIPMIIKIESVKPDGFLQDGESVSLGALTFSVIHTPGHSPGCVCFYFAKEGILFSGDVLFKGTHGNVSFPTSDERLIEGSLLKLMDLPDSVRVYPGHGEETTIGQERGWICR